MRKILSVLFILLFVFEISANGQDESDMTILEWEESAQLGQFRPETDDWEAIEAAAKKEETLVVYSLSSRVFEFGRSFYNKYGIRVEAHDITTPSLLEKLIREQDAGIHNADVILVDDIPTVYNEFLSEGRIYNFIPTDLYDLLPEDIQQAPMNIHHYGARGIAYNTSVYSEAPIDSWWDLTRPEWKGKILMKDPMNSGAEFNTFATFIQHSSEMEESYEEEFGVEMVRSDGIENAGYEFLKKLMDNDIILMADSGTVMKSVAASNQTDPPLGILGFSKTRTIIDEDMNAAFILDLSPVSGMRTTTVMGIGRFSDSPNAAKLMIKWMMGGDDPSESLAGYKPYHVVGNWPVRSDIPQPVDQPELDDKNFYKEDADWLYQNAIKVRDFWLQNQ